MSWTGLRLGLRWALPAIQAIPAWVFMTAALARGRRGLAIGLVIWWAFFLAITVVTFTMDDPQRAVVSIANGAQYRDEIFSWIRTGEGRESTPALFIPQHLTHALIFCVIGLATAGTVSLAMGAFLMNYMSFYVGELFGRCADLPGETAALLAAWNPWSIIRVASFIVLGVVLAEPLLSRWIGVPSNPAGRARWILAAVCGLGLDILLKTLLAPHWPSLLRPCLVP